MQKSFKETFLIVPMKAYLTWGIGYGKSRELAQINAQFDASLDRIKVAKLEKLEIPAGKIIEDKKELAKLKGNFKGIVLQNCAKSDVYSCLAFGITEDKIFVGKGKAAGNKAEKQAMFEATKAAGDKLESTRQIMAFAPYRKDQYGCAIVALVLVK
ncbi:MAG: hypothetical protein QXH80_00260 [Candidatus Nanoarchaeia archaeon]